MFDSHVFIAERVPTPREIHCLVTRLTNKKEMDFKVERNGRVISVVGEHGVMNPANVQLETNVFQFKRTSGLEPYAIEVGDIATVTTNLCYTIKRRPLVVGAAPMTVAPFDLLGRIKPELRVHFLDYLERHTGLKLYELHNGKVQMLSELAVTADANSDENKTGKVWFVGACHISIRAKVKNAACFASLSGRAIGNRRSYGFGSMLLNFVESADEVAGSTSGELVAGTCDASRP
jgi:hypothetical protein